MRHIAPGAMPLLNRYVGNPVMTAVMNRMFGTKISDAWCGMRGVRRDRLQQLDLRANGMEFAIEMVIRARDENLNVRELPISLHPRGGTSKLSRFRDGGRTLHLMLAYSPKYLFIIPALCMLGAGVFAISVVLADVSLFERHWYIHTLMAGALLVVIGVQLLGLGVCADALAAQFLGNHRTIHAAIEARGIRLKHALLTGGACVAAGVVLGLLIFSAWAAHSFGALSEQRLAVLSSMLLIVGVQIVFVALLISMLDFRGRRY
jgi:hypothetical protein